MSHALITGPIRGTVTTSDGTVYDVTPDVIYVANDSSEMVFSGTVDENGNPHMVPKHVIEIADAIGDRYATEGHQNHLYSDVPFVHDKGASFNRQAQDESPAPEVAQ